MHNKHDLTTNVQTTVNIRNPRGAPGMQGCTAIAKMLLAALLVLSGSELGFGQAAPAPYTLVPYEDLTVNTDIPHSADARVIRQTVGVDGGAWIIVRFESFNLGRNTLAIQSLEFPNQRQVFSQDKLTTWGGESARFAGGMVRITVSGPDPIESSSYVIKDFLVGERGLPDYALDGAESISLESLGSDDNRRPSFDDRIGRIMPKGCTAFALTSGALLTAGHCVTDEMIILEYRVPPSLDDGTTISSPVQHQFKIDRSSIIYSDEGPGEDWAVFRVHENDAGLTPEQIYGGFELATEAARGRIAVRGYGIANGVHNQTQQHDYGDLLSYKRQTSENPELIKHNAGTQPGSSGSPIFYIEASGKVVGIHTHGDANRLDDVLENRGTSFTQLELYEAISRLGRGIVTSTARTEFGRHVKEDSEPMSFEIDHGACFSRIYWLVFRAQFRDDMFDAGEVLGLGFNRRLENKGASSVTVRGWRTIWPVDTNDVLDGVHRSELSSLVGSFYVSEIESELVGHVIPCE